ncbi:MAG TPA: amino acid permease [Gammaproteobacteria bacterium]|nr:amino acid permease [Gammaproteobacteria bacterium]
MSSNTKNSRRILGVFTLAMINVAAIVSLRNLSIVVQYGFASVFYYLLGAIIFFLPTAFVCAELATTWPKAGGLYSWVSEAFGKRTGFFAVWISWMLSISWFPAVLTFSAAAIAYVVNPALSQDKIFMLGIMLGIFWIATIINFFGMRVSGWVSLLGAILGTLLPGVLIIGLGALWIGLGKEIKIEVSLSAFIPEFKITNMVLFIGLLFSLSGMELSAFHAREAKNPQRDYPRAIFMATILIMLISIFGSLAIAFVVSQKDASLFAGLMQAFTEFFTAFGVKGIVPWLALLATIGSLAGINTWILGPAKGILTSAEEGYLPGWMHYKNKKDMPVATLLVQAVVGSILSGVFYFMPDVESAFWIITALTVQFAMIMYALIFSAAIRLRYSQRHVPRPYKIPGGQLGIWVIGGLGFCTSVLAFGMAFIPPAQLHTGAIFFYDAYLIFGLVFLGLPPVILCWIKKPEWALQPQPII